MSVIGRYLRQLPWWLVPGLVGVGSVQAEFDHRLWDELLNDNVVEIDGGRVTAVDYESFADQQQQLDHYLDTLSGVDEAEFATWSADEQLAFLINTYNAWTIRLILTEYPMLESIRDIGFLPGAAWRRKIVALFGEKFSLDEVEHEMIRQWSQFQEPRIHFAVNCAAIGCPPLRREAYEGQRLQQQLENNTRLFLSDRDRNYLEGKTLYVSRIFDWYQEDFEKGWSGVESLRHFLARYAVELGLSNQEVADLLSGVIRIRYLSYDWGLNELPAAEP